MAVAQPSGWRIAVHALPTAQQAHCAARRQGGRGGRVPSKQALARRQGKQLSFLQAPSLTFLLRGPCNAFLVHLVQGWEPSPPPTIVC